MESFEKAIVDVLKEDISTNSKETILKLGKVNYSCPII
jgi:hypothetical protein